MTGSLDEARRFLSLLAQPGDVLELRALIQVNGQQHTTAGFFDDMDALARCSIDRSGKDVGVYVTINPLNDGLLHRLPKNQLHRVGKGDSASERDVRIRRSLLVDVDPVRPSGISSTNAEHEEAIVVARSIRDYLSSLGWPLPILADSGNGAHLIYAVNLPAQDDGLIQRVIKALSERFSSTTQKVDEKVFNASRISKIYGTLTRKGVNSTERPWRTARMLEHPSELVTVPKGMLESFAPAKDTNKKTSSSTRTTQGFDADVWMSEFFPEASEKPWPEGRCWVLRECPFDASHDRGEFSIVQRADGSMGASCKHDSCNHGWIELRTLVDTAYAERRARYENGNGSANGHKLTEREPPHEVLYESAEHAAELEAFASRDREPAQAPAPAKPAPPVWWRAPQLTGEIWARKDEPWIELRLADDVLCKSRAGGIVVVMGGSGSGKSSLVSNVMVQHARDIGPAICCSIELPADELAARIVGIRCDASWEDALRGQIKHEFMTQALNLPRLYVLDRKNATLDRLRDCITAAREEYPAEPILVAIDYAQLIQSKEREIRQRVTDAFDRIDDMAREMRVVAIAVSQMSRAGAQSAVSGEKLGAETASLGAESAAIERFATTTVSIGQRGQPNENDGSCVVELSVGKGRMSGGDFVLAARYWGRSGLWRVDGAPKPAAEVRAERAGEREQAKRSTAELAMMGACQQATSPMSREDLCQLVAGVRMETKRSAVAALIARGDLVEVRQRRARSKSWLIWTPDRARDAGVQLVRDVPGQED